MIRNLDSTNYPFSLKRSPSRPSKSPESVFMHPEDRLALLAWVVAKIHREEALRLQNSPDCSAGDGRSFAFSSKLPHGMESRIRKKPE
jgi:hypothetical protein